MSAVHVVVPGDVDDPARPSGGNVYDRRICLGLPAAGRPVRELPVPGEWPRPGAQARATLAALLAALPAGAAVLLDGLVACGVPDIVTPHAGRLRLTVLVHLPLGDEVGAARELAPLERATLRAATAVIATSPWAARRIRALHSVDARVVAPGVDPAPLAHGTLDGDRLLCVGSITQTKGQDLLVTALAQLADRSWNCLLVGPLTRDPAHVAAVRELVARHGLQERITLAGPRVGADLEAAYAASDLLVLPSRVEAYGMVVTEALARGIPVVAAAVDGVPETLAPAGSEATDVPGLLVPPGDVAALATALQRWLNEPALRQDLRRAARRRRQHLTGWEVTSRCLAKALP